MSNYAYGRVSAADQNLARQLDEFKAFGVPTKNIFSDKQSGKDFKRPNYRKLIQKLKRGDLLVIKSIDRLGRNYDMIIEEWARVTKTIGADIVVLDMPLLDTRARGDDLTGKFIADLVLQILSYVAQKERENIKARQREGIASAKRRGVRFGRPCVGVPDDFAKIVSSYLNRDITIDQALCLSCMKKSTFYTHMHELLAPAALS